MINEYVLKEVAKKAKTSQKLVKESFLTTTIEVVEFINSFYSVEGLINSTDSNFETLESFKNLLLGIEEKTVSKRYLNDYTIVRWLGAYRDRYPISEMLHFEKHATVEQSAEVVFSCQSRVQAQVGLIVNEDCVQWVANRDCYTLSDEEGKLVPASDSLNYWQFNTISEMIAYLDRYPISASYPEACIKDKQVIGIALKYNSSEKAIEIAYQASEYFDVDVYEIYERI